MKRLCLYTITFLSAFLMQSMHADGKTCLSVAAGATFGLIPLFALASSSSSSSSISLNSPLFVASLATIGTIDILAVGCLLAKKQNDTLPFFLTPTFAIAATTTAVASIASGALVAWACYKKLAKLF